MPPGLAGVPKLVGLSNETSFISKPTAACTASFDDENEKFVRRPVCSMSWPIISGSQRLELGRADEKYASVFFHMRSEVSRYSSASRPNRSDACHSACTRIESSS